MNEMRLLAIERLNLLWLIPVLIAAIIYAAHARKKALQRFADADLLERISMTVNPARRNWKSVLAVIAFGFVVLGLARPAWNPVEEEVQRRGRDVVFLLDVSRSMLAEDLAPNRLERAKLAILDSVAKLQGDRVALVVFAGNSVVKCPLTHDYGFFRMALEDVSPDSVSRGGTLIGDAIRSVIEQVFDNQARGHRDVILITDGEDHESFPVEAAQKLGELEVRLIAIGLGDENQGRRIPVTDENGRRRFMTYQGEEIWTKLDADTLRKMVNATPGGRYLNVATGAIDLGDVYLRLVATAGKTDLGSSIYERYEEKYQIFLGFGFLLLCAGTALRERK
jgi:Ca-activated chloride channel homolog